MGQHTKTPWHAEDAPDNNTIGSVRLHAIYTGSSRGRSDTLIAKVSYGGKSVGEASANAAFIVRACNAHEELLEALEEMIDWYVRACSCLHCDTGRTEATLKARAAIAKARAK